MHAVSALFHGKTSSNNKIGKTNTWMDKIADIYLFLFWPFARKQSITWVCCCCCYASIFIISSFWLSSFLASQLQILLSQHTLSFWLFFQKLHHFRCRSSSFLRRLGFFVLFLSIPFLGFTQPLNRSVAVLLRCCLFRFLAIILQASRICGRFLFFYDFFLHFV